MQERKQTNFKTPDISKMQEVVIDARTKIYIEHGASPEEARSRYLNRLETKGKVLLASRKPVVA